MVRREARQAGTALATAEPINTTASQISMVSGVLTSGSGTLNNHLCWVAETVQREDITCYHSENNKGSSIF